jgi:ribosomal protein L4
MRVKALFAVLSKKFEDGEILFLDAMTFDAPKTKDAKNAITALATIKGFEKLATKRTNTALIASIKTEDNTVKSMRNFNNFMLEHVRSLNPVDVLTYKYLVLVGGVEAVKEIESRGGDTVVSK